MSDPSDTSAAQSPGQSASQDPGLDHGPGSFAKNNAADLPGQETTGQAPDRAPDVRDPFQDTRPAEVKAQEAELSKPESHRRVHHVGKISAQPKATLSKAKYKAARTAPHKSHAPREELSMETDLPHKEAVDREMHNQRQSKEDYLARRGQPRAAKARMKADQEKKIEAAQKPDIHSRESYIKARYAKALKADKPLDRSR